MAEVELVRDSCNSAGSAITHVENVSTKEANLLLDEAEETLSLALSILYRSVNKTLNMRELV